MKAEKYYIGRIDGAYVGIVGDLLQAQRDSSYPFMESMQKQNFEEVKEEEYKYSCLDMRFEMNDESGEICWHQ